MYIKPNSRHEKHILKNFVIAEICRIRSHCNTSNEFYRHCQIFYNNLIRREYSKEWIIEQFETATNSKTFRRAFNNAMGLQSNTTETEEDINPIREFGPILILPERMKKRYYQRIQNNIKLPIPITSLIRFKNEFATDKFCAVFNKEDQIGKMQTNLNRPERPAGVAPGRTIPGRNKV